MATAIKYGSAWATAKAMCEDLRARGHEPMTARPYQHQRPEETIWWNIPSSDWPAYRHGKLFFTPDESPAGEVFCGLHVEKGLDPKVAVAAPSGKGRWSVMRPDWQWHKFLADLDGPTFRSACDKVAKVVEPPLLIEVQSYYVLDASKFDPDAPRPKGDDVVFEVVGTDLRLHEPPELPARILSGVAKSTSLAALATALRTMPGAEFCWVDVLVGSLFEPGSKTGWDASNLWSRSLSAWEPWFA